MKKFKDNELVILLGAGASCDATILNSAQMINRIETKLKENNWRKYSELYYYIKSVHFKKQISHGSIPTNVSFNIEDLVSLLDIIYRITNKEIETYNFVGSWEKDLNTFILNEQQNKVVSEFKENIIKELRGEWLMPDNWIQKSNYYKKIIDFKNEYDGFALKIFSLNYDLCVEKNLKDEKIELGFDENDYWNFRRYDYENSNNETSYYLYKLHGSIDWQKTKEDRLIKKTGDIKTDELAIIFGMSNKLQSYDPYLFYFYEFREHCLKANLLISSGYSFLDGHINDVIKGGFKSNPNKKLVVNVFENKKDDSVLKKEIAEILKISESQIIIYNKKAVEFFNEDLKLKNFENMFDEEENGLPKDF